MLLSLFLFTLISYGLMNAEMTGHLVSFQTFTTLKSMIVHFVMTMPSLIIHTLQNKYYYYTLEKSDNVPLNNHNVIVFVHGRNGCFTDFKSLIDNINRIGDQLSRIELENHGFSEKEIVVRLPDQLLYVLRSITLGQTGYTSLDSDVESLTKEISGYTNCSIRLVGLSKGGLIIMRYVTSQNDPRIKQVITISSPLKGTFSALLFPPSSIVAKTLGYQSEIIQQIEKDRKKITVPIYHIVPKWDHLIIPNIAAQYDDTPESQIYLDNGNWYGHNGITYNMDVAKSLIKWIISVK